MKNTASEQQLTCCVMVFWLFWRGDGLSKVQTTKNADSVETLLCAELFLTQNSID